MPNQQSIPQKTLSDMGFAPGFQQMSIPPNTQKTYSDMGYSEFSADNIYMKGDCAYIGNALYVCLKDTNHLASAPFPSIPTNIQDEYGMMLPGIAPNVFPDPRGNEYWRITAWQNGISETILEDLLEMREPSNFETTFDVNYATEEPDTAPLLLPEDSEPLPPPTGGVTATVAPKKKGGKKK